MTEKLEAGCYVHGLYMEGAGWDAERMQLKKQEPKVLVIELPLLPEVTTKHFQRRGDTPPIQDPLTLTVAVVVSSLYLSVFSGAHLKF